MKKTQKLLDFGTKQVVWIFTDPRKVMTATKDEPWLTVNWNHPITVLKQEFTLETFLREKGIIKAISDNN